jgi:protein-disulfide isomerase
MSNLPAAFRAGAIGLAMLAALGISGGSSIAEDIRVSEEKFGQMVRDYLLKHPEVLREVIEALEKKEKVAEGQASTAAIKAHAGELFRSADDFVAGNPAGKVSVVEFFDYNCGYCKRSLPDVLKLTETDKDVRLVIKEFPILGPGSLVAAKAAVAARRQKKYWEFHLALMKETGAIDEARVFAVAKAVGLDVAKLRQDMEDAEVAKIIARNHATAEALGIQGTPAFVIDQTLVPGALGFEALAGAVAAVRESGGCKLC